MDNSSFSADADTTEAGGSPSTLSYEQARAELAAVVERLESGAGTLEESLRLWERGEALASACQGHLDTARQRLEQARAARRSESTQTPSHPSGGDTR